MTVLPRIRIVLLAALLLAVGCASKPMLLSSRFERRDRLSITVPKYKSSEIESRFLLKLHPDDIVLNVDLHYRHGSFAQRRDFQYDPETGDLSVRFTLDAEHTVVPGAAQLDVTIAYLACYELFRQDRQRRVYEYSEVIKTLVYRPVAPKTTGDGPIDGAFNQGLSADSYQRLYREIRSLPGSDRRALQKRLDETFIKSITNKAVEDYAATALNLLEGGVK